MFRSWLKICAQVLLATAFSAHAQGDAYVSFFRAVDRDDVSTVDRLLARGFPVDAVDERGQPAFVLALRAPAPRVAERLFAHPGFDPEQTTSAGETPLLMAALAGDPVWTRRLVERGARLVSPSGWSAVHYAASAERPEALAWLLDRRPPLDVPAPNGNTALMMAARWGDQRNVGLLLDAGADPTPRNRQGFSAADFARAVGRDRLAERLDQASAARTGPTGR